MRNCCAVLMVVMTFGFFANARALERTGAATLAVQLSTCAENSFGQSLAKSFSAQLASLDFKISDSWCDTNYVFGYGVDSKGSLILFGWKQASNVPSLKVRALARFYADEKLTPLKSEAELNSWERMRNALIGPIIDAENGDRVMSIETTDFQGQVEMHPFILKISTPKPPVKLAFASVAESDSR